MNVHHKINLRSWWYKKYKSIKLRSKKVYEYKHIPDAAFKLNLNNKS